MNIREIFELENVACDKGGKVVPLNEAIVECVRPGMKLHVSTGAYPNAALREIIRCYWGRNPEFTLVSSGVTTPFEICLTLSGLVKKIVTTNHSYTYPTPRPIPLLQKMEKQGLLDIEHWSLYSLEQRLMAGALGVGFMPTKSLMGSSLADENQGSFAMMRDPFDAEASIGVVKALSPDISIIHGCVADCEGNTILSPPYFSSLWGSRASKGGVIVTVEKIVPPEVIRKYAALVKIPGHLVRCVCPVSFGSHPQGLAAESVGVAEGYGEDYEFIQTFVEASQSEEGLKEWVEEWVLGCNDQEGYLQRLGVDRIMFLKGKSSVDAWKYEKAAGDADKSDRSSYNATEMMAIAGAREIADAVRKNGYKNILAGIGTPALAAWVAFYMLKSNNERVDLLTGLGHVGYAPRPGDPFLMTLSNVASSAMLTDTTEVYGVFVGGANNRCLSVVGTAQIDKYGNINTVKMGDYNFIGVGGAGDAVNARETLVVAKQSRNRFMEKVPFVGCPGKGIKTLVTDLGVFKKLNDEETFSLTHFFSGSADSGKEERVQKIRNRCGWEVKLAQRIEEVLPPTSEELAILRSLDPKGIFIGK